jgi:hypothetical protein
MDKTLKCMRIRQIMVNHIKRNMLLMLSGGVIGVITLGLKLLCSKSVVDHLINSYL